MARWNTHIKILMGSILLLCAKLGWAEPSPPLPPGAPAREATRYALTATTQSEVHDPTAWRLLASNDDGKHWDTLDVRTNQQFTGRSERRTYYIRNRRPYTLYRLQIDAVNSTNILVDMGVELADLSLIGPLVNVANESQLEPIVTSSCSNPVIGPPEYAFDGDPSTIWSDYGLWSPRGCWIQIRYATNSETVVTNLYQASQLAHQFAAQALLADGGARALSNLTARAVAPRRLAGYALTSANDEPERDPRDWQLLGSDDDGKTWNVLDTRVNQIFTERFQRRIFNVTNAVATRLCRLQITASATTNTDCQLAEVEPLYADPQNNGTYSLVVEASNDNPPLESTEMAFDGDSRTKWLSFYPPLPNQPCWIQWQLIPREEELPVVNQQQLDRLGKRLLTDKLLQETNVPFVTATGYALTSANDYPGRDPGNWSLLGSSDAGKTWRTLDTRQDETFPQRLQRRVFKLETPATCQFFRLAIRSVSAPTNANSVQLGELELLLERPSQANLLTALVSASGENPPIETVDNLFDKDPKTKWLDYSTASPERSGWIEWHYAPQAGHHAVDMDREQVAQSLSPKRLRLQMTAALVLTNASAGLVGLADETGFQWIHLDPWPANLAPGSLARLAGVLELRGQSLFLSNARLESIQPLPFRPDALTPDAPSHGQHFISTSVTGRVTGVFSASEYSGATLTLADGSSIVVRSATKDFPTPPGTDCPVKVTGVLESLLTSRGNPAPGVMWVSDSRTVVTAPATEEDWNELPEYALSMALPAVVRVRGVLTNATASGAMLVCDQTNSIFLDSAGPLEAGSTVQAAGVLSRENGQLILRHTLTRTIGARAAPAVTAPTLLTTMSSVRQYLISGAMADVPVKVRGIVTYINLNLGDFYLQDGKDSVEVIGQMNAGLAPKLSEEGSYIELQGVIHQGNLYATTFVQILGKGKLPEPVRPSWDYLMSGNEDGSWVEVEGVIVAADRQRLTLNVSGGQLIAWINELDKSEVPSLPGNVARVRGVCSPVVNSRYQRLGVRLLVPQFDCVDLVAQAPQNPFDLPLTPINAVMRADAAPGATPRERIKTRGVVTCRQGRMLFLQDGTDGIRVTLREDLTLAPGDIVEAVGMPQPDGFSPKLIQALAQKVGHTSVPQSAAVDLIDTTSEDSAQQRDATRGVMQGVVLNESADAARWTLSLRDEKSQQVFSAYFPAGNWGSDAAIPAGSRVRLTGVFKALLDKTPDVDQAATSFEMYLNSPGDITVLERPSWWTSAHTLQLAGVFIGILTVALGWIWLLRDQVRQRTHALNLKIEEHERSEALLAAEVTERRRLQAEAEKTHKELLIVARQAGMAEVATGILHNVGNVLNSVSVSSSLMIDRLRRSRVGRLENAVALLRQNEGELGPFFKTDPKGQKILPYLEQLAGHLTTDQAGALQELEGLDKNIEHIKDIVTVQQNSAKFAGLTEPLHVAELVEDALRMNASSLERHGVDVVKKFDPNAPLAFADRHKVLQILVNLIRNAKQACDRSNETNRSITIITSNGGGSVKVAIADTGVGILPENLSRVFNHGFTTRKDGHGFGLHNAALFAKEMGGALRVSSEGVGRGATFTLELPMAMAPQSSK